MKIIDKIRGLEGARPEGKNLSSLGQTSPPPGEGRKISSGRDEFTVSPAMWPVITVSPGLF